MINLDDSGYLQSGGNFGRRRTTRLDGRIYRRQMALLTVFGIVQSTRSSLRRLTPVDAVDCGAVVDLYEAT